MNEICTFIGIYVDVILLVYLTGRWKRKKGSFYAYIVYFLYGLVIYAENKMGFPICIKLVSNFLIMVLVFSFLHIKMSFLSEIKFMILYFILLSMPEIILTAMIYSIFDCSVEDLYASKYLWFVCLMLSKLLTFFLIMALSKMRNLNEGDGENRSIKNAFEMFPLFLPLGIFTFHTYIIIRTNEYNKNILIFMIIIIIIVLITYTFSNIILYNDWKYEKKQVQFLETKNIKQYNYYQQKSDAEIELRKIYHDMKNDMLVLKKYENSDIYMNHIVNTIQKLDDFVDTGNEMLNIVLFEKMKVTRTNAIDFKLMIDFSKCNFLSDMEICTLFGNLIDNAIEACCKMEAGQDKYINLKCRAIENRFIIKIENSYAEKVLYHHGMCLTTKQNKKGHGIGMTSIKGIVDSHFGNMSVNYTDTEFCVSILFYL